MENREFLQVLYGKVNQGALSVSWRVNGKLSTKWYDATELNEMSEFIVKTGRNHDTSINLNPRAKSLTCKQRGTREDILIVIGYTHDYDIRDPVHSEQRLPETKEELMAFVRSLPKQPSIIVFSGHGYHCYYLFDEPIVIHSDDERDRIEQIGAGYEAFVKDKAFREHSWAFDTVSYLNRMVRAPGTLNHKTKDKVECQVVETSDVRYSLSDFEGYKGYAPQSHPSYRNDSSDPFALMGTGSCEPLFEKCEFIRHCRDDAETLPEPEWYGLATIVSQTADGNEKFHEVSEPYAGYYRPEAEYKFRKAAQENKPVTCEYIKKVLGFDCGKDCGVRSPISLIRTRTPDRASEWTEPLPFDEVKLPVFPVHVLPKAIRDYVLAVAEFTQTPVDMAASCAIAVVAVGIQGKYVVEANEGWDEPVNIYILIIMNPSERKSPVMKLMVQVLHKYETEYNRQHAGAVIASSAKKRMLQQRLRSAEDQVAKGKVDISEIDKAAAELAAFKEETPLQLLADNVTVEKLVSILSANDGRAAIISTEGGLFINLAGVYTKNVNIDPVLQAFSGDPIRVDRIGRKSESIENPSLTLCLMAQPSVLSEIMENKNFSGKGFLARLMYSMPASMIGNRVFRAEPIPASVTRAYEDCILNGLREEYPPTPEVMTLSPEADAKIEAFSNEVESKLKTDYADIGEWAGKIVGTTLRIAGLLYRASITRSDFMDERDSLVIDGKTMDGAIQIARYYIAHAKAAFALMGADAVVKQCKYVLAAIKEKHLERFNTRDIMRLCRSFKRAEDLQPVLNRLEDYGYIAVEDPKPYSGKGRPPAQMYLVNPLVYE